MYGLVLLLGLEDTHYLSFRSNTFIKEEGYEDYILAFVVV